MHNDPELTHKEIPDVLAQEIKVALSYYPELAETPIAFRFKKDIKKSTMQAQPAFSSLLNPRAKRKYFVFISEKIQIETESFKITDIPSDVLIGWIGHELGHIMDYKNRSSLGLVWFGLKYLYFPKFIREAERAADTFAVSHGMGKYILVTKDFILNHAHISAKYKARIKRLYLSPEEIMLLINENKNLEEELEV
ncbi:MAG: hypothetical protein VYB38_05315 [Bacteroidota bacterium]|uniref:hypothetical protein n=1 Tax=Leeuwenhoekiella palythoae TaxID=573501 RepID=UPI001CE218C0|nr:hypothetical protein [Leeuwenhoekiella palythoae]MEC7782803.1 hypothetical protein [Bacteroidota bacterium]MEC8682801.1 hypothetical protein [Bacteroidota bacterium]MEC8885449.1 hypothetical protein [Bacteroidota bacterium]MEE3148151.1 hypothetical protein [Bacteroidota bacterium]MEE3227144.1 hypothetical protein [Bacteroidota bacterium]